MKTLLSIFLFIEIFLGSIGCVRAQNDDKQIIAMLKEFYTEYNTNWVNVQDPYVLKEKLDSLQQKYCTVSLRNTIKKISQKNGLDHDILINDLYADVESLKTLSITKDSTKANSYIVSYIANTFDPSNRKIKEKVTIHLTVVKEKGSYKINDVL